MPTCTPSPEGFKEVEPKSLLKSQSHIKAQFSVYGETLDQGNTVENGRGIPTHSCMWNIHIYQTQHLTNTKEKKMQTLYLFIIMRKKAKNVIVAELNTWRLVKPP